jgi:hypothetical protein
MEEVDLHDFLGIEPGNEYLAYQIPGQTPATQIAVFLKDYIELRDPSGVPRAGLRNENETALVIFGYSQKPRTLPVTIVGKEKRLTLAGDNMSVILAADGKQRRLLVTEPLKGTTLVLAFATDYALFYLDTIEVVHDQKS